MGWNNSCNEDDSWWCAKRPTQNWNHFSPRPSGKLPGNSSRRAHIFMKKHHHAFIEASWIIHGQSLAFNAIIYIINITCHHYSLLYIYIHYIWLQVMVHLYPWHLTSDKKTAEPSPGGKTLGDSTSYEQPFGDDTIKITISHYIHHH